MVKIRYATIDADGIYRPADYIIREALTATSAKFDNNIVANRFEQVGSHYEVTIKCISSRGKGAKRGASGRRTTSCCWHVWGTFFDELFRANPNIVVVAQGNRIARETGNWVDRDVGNGIRESEMCNCRENGWVREQETHAVAEHADSCGVYMPDEEDVSTDTVHEQWIAQQNAVSAEISRREGREALERSLERAVRMADETIDNMIAATARAETTTTRHECDASCRHNSANNGGTLCNVGEEKCIAPSLGGWEPVTPIERHECDFTCRHARVNNNGMPCTRSCQGHTNPGWEPVIVTPQQPRSCRTCRYSYNNQPDGRSRCPSGSCHDHEGLQLWAPITVIQSVTFRDEPNTACSMCRHVPSRNNHVLCPFNEAETCLIDRQHRNFERWVAPVPVIRKCSTCRYSCRNTRDGRSQCPSSACAREDGLQLWAPIIEETPLITPVVKTCQTCYYNWDENGEQQMCRPIVGLCRANGKWEPMRTPFVIEGTPVSRYDTQMVEQGQVELLVEFPMLKEE